MNIYNSVTAGLYFIAIATVVVSATLYEDALKIMTRESGFFEWSSVVVLLLITVVGMRWVFRHGAGAHRLVMFGVTLFSLLTFLAAMEEISWGQHLFHFQSSEFFVQNNHQQETNLHNFMPAELFSSLIYSSVYTFFIFIPLTIRLFERRLRWFAALLPWIPSLHVTLIVIFAALFQAYFYDNFGAWFDFATMIVSMLFFATVVSIKKLWNRALALHFGVVVVTLPLFMLCHEVFGFFNMQYEIREMFVVIATLYYFVSLLERIDLGANKTVAS